MGEREKQEVISRYTQLKVYRRAYRAAMRIFELSGSFPHEERYSLTDQVRRSSRSVCANLSEAWHKRRYELAFISKLSDSEAEAGETQTWLRFSVDCGYLDRETGAQLSAEYHEIISMLVDMLNHPEHWLIRKDK